MRKMTMRLSCIILFAMVSAGGATAVAKENIIKIGAVNCLSGPAAMFGTQGSKVQHSAVDKINQQGGIDIGGKKYKIKYIEYDDESKNDKARAAAERLATVDNVVVVVNSYRSSGALALKPVADKYKIPMFTNGFSPKVNNQGSYVFRVQPNTSMDSLLPLKYLYEKTDNRNIGILAEEGAWGDDVISLIKWWTGKFGGSCKVLGRFPFAEKDFHALITKAKISAAKKEIDAVYVQTWASAMELFIRQAAESGLDRKVQLLSGLGAVDYISLANVTPQVKGWIGASFFGIMGFIDDPRVRRAFSQDEIGRIEAYKAEGFPVSGISLTSYTNMMVALEAIQRAQSTDPQKIRDALAGMTVNTLAGDITFSDLGQPAIKMSVVKMELSNGKIIPAVLQRETIPPIISFPPSDDIKINIKH